jgi:ABC-type sugar transport system permease subunit
MNGPRRIHHLIAGVLLVAVTLTLGLALRRYQEELDARRLAVWDTMAEALALAGVSEDASEIEAWVTLRRAARPKMERYFYLKAGHYIEALDLSEPSTFAYDSDGDVDLAVGDLRLGEMVSTLEQYVVENEGDITALSTGDLWWATPTSDGGQRLVAVFPVVTDGALAGVAGVEMTPDVGRRWLVPGALGVLALFAGLFLLALWRWPARPGTGFFVAALVSGAAASVAIGVVAIQDQQRVSAARNGGAALLVNDLGPASPELLVSASRVWNQIWRHPAPTLGSAGAAPGGAEGTVHVVVGPVRATEDARSVMAQVEAALVPFLVLLLLLLLVGSWGTAGLGRLVHGMVTMPGAYAYVVPAMVGMVVLVLIPFAMGVLLGFFTTDYEFIGLNNFREILFPADVADTNFYFTLGVTVLWTVTNVVLHVSIGLALALVLNNPAVKGRTIFRVLLIIPWAVPNYITALIWKWMFNYEFGAINLMLQAIGVSKVAWFGTSFWTNFFANLATNTWLGFPFMMVVSLGALQSIPGELYEAADIDGASRWQKFRGITLPLLKPALFPAIILGTIWTFNMFNVIYLVSGGGPDNQTNILITEAYRFFKVLNRYGFAAAYCLMIFVILLLYTVITNRVTKATEGSFE